MDTEMDFVKYKSKIGELIEMIDTGVSKSDFEAFLEQDQGFRECLKKARLWETEDKWIIPHFIATLKGRVDLLEHLISEVDVPVNSRWIIGSEYDCTTLHCAIVHNRAECVRVLLENGAETSSAGKYKGWLFENAPYLCQKIKTISWSYDDKIMKMLKSAEQGDLKETIDSIHFLHGKELRLLIDASKNIDEIKTFLGEHPGLIKYLTQADNETMRSRWKYPLFRAAYHGRDELVRLFIEDYKIPVNLQYDNGANECSTAIHAAICKNRIECVRILLEHGADISLGGKTFGLTFQNALDLFEQNNNVYKLDDNMRQLLEPKESEVEEDDPWDVHCHNNLDRKDLLEVELKAGLAIHEVIERQEKELEVKFQTEADGIKAEEEKIVKLRAEVKPSEERIKGHEDKVAQRQQVQKMLQEEHAEKVEAIKKDGDYRSKEELGRMTKELEGLTEKIAKLRARLVKDDLE